ncbi:zinc-dependent alcohol dehydrogenase family protein [Aquipseudomonas campi]
MQIRAAVLDEMGLPAPFAESKPLRIEKIELADPGPGEVLIKIAAAGICHSDLSIIEGVRPRPLPMVIGHEAAGVVVAVGPYVDELAVGDHVVTVFVAACGHCVECSGGRPALCAPGAVAGTAGTLLRGDRRLSRGAQVLNHHSGISAFAEYAVVSTHSLVKIDREVPLEHAALFGCAVLTGVGAATNSASITLGSTVAIVGMGGVGLAALLGALAAGASQVIAIDTNPEKLAMAKALGASHAFDATDPNLVEAIRELTKGGVDVALEFAGAPAALETAWKVGKRGGEVVTAGLARPSATFSVPMVGLVAEERILRGSYMGSSVPNRDIPRYLELFRLGRLPIDKLVTHRLPLDEINIGMDRLRNGEAVRQVITFD